MDTSSISPLTLSRWHLTLFQTAWLPRGCILITWTFRNTAYPWILSNQGNFTSTFSHHFAIIAVVTPWRECIESLPSVKSSRIRTPRTDKSGSHSVFSALGNGKRTSVFTSVRSMTSNQNAWCWEIQTSNSGMHIVGKHQPVSCGCCTGKLS